MGLVSIFSNLNYLFWFFYLAGRDQHLALNQDRAGGGVRQVRQDQELRQQTEACQDSPGTELDTVSPDVRSSNA